MRQHGSGSTFRLRYHSWHVIVRQQGQLSGQSSTILWNICLISLVSRSLLGYSRGMKLVELLSGYADADWGDSPPRSSTSGTIMLYKKSPMMRKLKTQKTWRSSRRRQDTTPSQHQWLAARSFTSGQYCFRAREAYPCIRGQYRASSGVTL